MTYDYNTAFDLALLDAYNAALRLGSQPRTSPEVDREPLPIKPRKPYESRFIGVSKRYTGYCGHWAPAPGKYVRGPVRPTEEEAARDRAHALGRDYLEIRTTEVEP